MENQNVYNNGVYEKLNPSWHAEDSYMKALCVHNFLLKNNIMDFKSVCDTGCGAGQVLVHLKQMLNKQEPLSYVGYDISERSIEICHSYKHKGIEYACQDITKLDVYFDLILCLDVLEHVEDVFGLLKSLRSKGTNKVFMIPLDVTAHSVLKDFVTVSFEKYYHIHYFCLESALLLLRKCGYEICDYELIPYSYRAKQLGLKLSTREKIKYIILDIIAKAWSSEVASRVMGNYVLMVLAK